jgi:SH3-like domain-containing protein
MSPFRFCAAAALLSLFFLSPPASAAAQEDKDTPYWASIRAEEVNMRVGPNENYRIAWVYRRLDLPLKVVRKKDGWRLVRDADGAQGWVVSRFLSRERTAIVTGKVPVPMREQPTDGSTLRWKVVPGVVGRLGDCEDGWCRFNVGGRQGWARQDRLWGAGEP